MSRSIHGVWRIALACVLVCASVSAWGSDPVHKCRGQDGQTHYQAAACTATQRTEWVREFPVDPPAPTAAARMPPASPATVHADRPRRQGGSGTRRRQASPTGAVISMHRDAVACERAKQARDQAHARLGLKRDFATSRKLDDRISEACR